MSGTTASGGTWVLVWDESDQPILTLLGDDASASIELTQEQANQIEDALA